MFINIPVVQVFDKSGLVSGRAESLHQERLLAAGVAEHQPLGAGALGGEEGPQLLAGLARVEVLQGDRGQHLDAGLVLVEL